MNAYIIYSLDSEKQYRKEFETSIDARNWVINHLDLSLNWTCDRYAHIDGSYYELLHAVKHGYEPTDEQETRLREWLDNESQDAFLNESRAVI